MTARRLETGGLIDRAARLRFFWDGRTLSGHPGDTLASALLANDVAVVGRSFKYHRPRGVMSAGVEESGAIVTTGAGARRVANVRATSVELFEGLEAHGQNAWPSVRFDLGRVNDVMSRFLAAGFYYKTFMGVGRGVWTWMQFEKLIRRAAGMGRAAREPDPDAYEIVNDHCDVLVIGAGPAGLAAAAAAADAGLDVVLAEQDFAPGGDLLGAPGGDVAARVAALAASGNVRLWTRATVFGLYDGNVAGVVERVADHLASPPPHLPRERLRVVRAARIVLASGAIERPIAFGGNDRPGVMNASAARLYARRFGVLAGRRIVLAATHDGAYAEAVALADCGAQVLLADAREAPPEALIREAGAAGVEVARGYMPVETRGGRRVRGVWLGRHRGGGRVTPERDVDADCVAVAGGWSPAIHLLSHRKIRAQWSGDLACFLPAGTDLPIHVAGAASGVWDAADCAASGRAAGLSAAKALGAWGGAVPAAPAPRGRVEPVFEIAAEGRKLKSFVDPQHDVTTADIRLAHREGFVSVEHLKRYTTLGMATDQGKIGNVIGLALMAGAAGRSIAETGTTTFRPPYTPVSMGVLAGHERGAHWRPTRLTPMHDAAVAAGAVFTDAGAWRRAWYFPGDGEGMAAAARRETRTVRGGVGMADVSTLGKIAVQGPDAATFLDRVYVNGFAKLPVGKARYGVMLREDGIVFDDGTTWRLAETEYFMTTTTAQAGEAMKLLDRLLQTRWPDLRVHVSSVSDQWAGLSVAGPRARAVLSALSDDIDFSDAAFPFMGVREGRLRAPGGDIGVRVARISFSGEQAWEVFAPADYGPALWAAVGAEVARAGGAPYGLEALDCLRVEKGHVTGREIDGRTTLEDIGLGRMASNKKPFLGSVLRQRPDLVREDRPRLVGLKPVHRSGRFRAGAILCEEGKVAGHGVGWVSSVADSPTLDHWLGLGFAAGGVAAWAGRTLIAADPVNDAQTEVEVVSPHFYDPDGGRMHG